jgi:hypothetical protein
MAYFLILLAVWPVLGVVVLHLYSRRAGGRTLPPASSGSDVLARMYLWPVVCWRLRARDSGPGMEIGKTPSDDR